MGKLILVRHAETKKNIDIKLHSASDSESLTTEGIVQMEKTAERLKSMDVEKIYSSKEIRAIESAEILVRHLHVPLIPVMGMQERNWGNFAGQPWAEVEKMLVPMSLWERYEYVPQGGESWKMT